MNQIMINRKRPTSEERVILVRKLKDVLKKTETGQLICLEEDGELLEGVLVPYCERYALLFKDLYIEGAVRMELKWGDPDLCAELGMFLIQHVISGGKQKAIFGHRNKVFFSLVDKEFYNKYQD